MNGSVGNAILLVVAAALASVSVTTQARAGTAVVFDGVAPALSVTSQADSAHLFAANFDLVPGQTRAHSVTVNKRGGRSADRVGLYLGRFEAKSVGSSPLCLTRDPADKIVLGIRTEHGSIYDGTLSDFAEKHGSAGSALWLRDVTIETVTFTVGLDPSAGNGYMGCRSTADVTWTVD